MGNRHSILQEIAEAEHPQQVLQKYFAAFGKVTGRNTIAYYSGWQSKVGPNFENLVSINDDDMYGFMSCMYEMDFKQGLNLILHTPGGSVASAEALINYLRTKFGKEIYVYVPELAMSSGTLVAMAGKEIWMGAHSNLGPVDPHYGGIPAREILTEFARAGEEIRANTNNAYLWRPILERYSPSFIGKCENALALAEEIAVTSLRTGMFEELPAVEAEVKAKGIANQFLTAETTRTHDRHIPATKCLTVGLNVKTFEEHQEIQNTILPLHHALKILIDDSPAFKIIMNHNGVTHNRSYMMPPQPQSNSGQPPRGVVAEENNAAQENDTAVEAAPARKAYPAKARPAVANWRG